jgi:hypothetical protein
MDKPELTLEFPAHAALFNATDHAQMEAAIGCLVEEHLPDLYGARTTIHPVPYDGEPGILQGGRDNPPPVDALLAMIDAFNRRGVPFAVAMNGGRGLPASVFDKFSDPVLASEYVLLDRLANNSAKYPVRNRVILTRRELLPIIAEHFQGVDTVASAVNFMGGKRGEFLGTGEYDRAFEEHDYVCPANQHATPDFLRAYAAYVKKMVLLIGADCGNPNMKDCDSHHACQERYPLIIEPRDFVFIPSQLPKGCESCMLYHDNEGDADLAFRKTDLEELIRMGVDQFKLPRSLSSIWHGHTVLTLVDTFADVKERAEQFPAEVKIK